MPAWPLDSHLDVRDELLTAWDRDGYHDLQHLTEAGVRHAVLGDEPPADPEPVEFEVQLDVVPASLAKGLEFDHVVLLEPAAIVGAEPDRVTGLRRLYVCLTRAVTSLTVLHGEAVPDELAG